MLQLKMVILGILFACGPLMVNRSGLDGPTASALSIFVLGLVIVPVSFYQGVTLGASLWWWAVLASLIGSVAIIGYNAVITSVTPQEIGQLAMITVLSQVTCFGIWHMYSNGQFSLNNLLWLLAAITVIALAPRG